MSTYSSVGKQAPDRLPLTPVQARRLAAVTQIDETELTGRTVAELSEQYRWQVDPHLFRFHRIYGEVIRKNPMTGVDYPVKFAKVDMRNTQDPTLRALPAHLPCSLLFPGDGGEQHRQSVSFEYTTAENSEKFCVWMARFEIEWLQRFRARPAKS